jgi:hypothetical protein
MALRGKPLGFVRDDLNTQRMTTRGFLPFFVSANFVDCCKKAGFPCKKIRVFSFFRSGFRFLKYYTNK